MKKLLHILPVVLVISFFPEKAHAGFLSVIIEFITGLFASSPLHDLSNNIVRLAEKINESTSDMMRFGDMLLCSSMHGSAADFDLLGIVSKKLVAPSIFLSGGILYIIGFLIMLMTSFYLFDAAFNLAVSIILLPLALALWPFGWTRDKLKIIISSIVYYVGLFIFLPLGVLMAKEIAFTVVQNTFYAASDFDFIEAYKQDQADLIEDKLGIASLPFLKVLLCYVVALRIIPLMAADFCKYFFGSAIGGSPIMQKLTEMSRSLMKQGKKARKFGADVLKHQTGNFIYNHSGKHKSFMSAALGRFGSNMARTQRWGKADDDAWRRTHS